MCNQSPTIVFASLASLELDLELTECVDLAREHNPRVETRPSLIDFAHCGLRVLVGQSGIEPLHAQPAVKPGGMMAGTRLAHVASGSRVASEHS